jgi:hypothetical protein
LPLVHRWIPLSLSLTSCHFTGWHTKKKPSEDALMLGGCSHTLKGVWGPFRYVLVGGWGG